MTEAEKENVLKTMFNLLPKEEREDFYRKKFNLDDRDMILWEDNEGINVRKFGSIEKVEIKITIDKEGNITYDF